MQGFHLFLPVSVEVAEKLVSEVERLAEDWMADHEGAEHETGLWDAGNAREVIDMARNSPAVEAQGACGTALAQARSFIRVTDLGGGWTREPLCRSMLRWVLQHVEHPHEVVWTDGESAELGDELLQRTWLRGGIRGFGGNGAAKKRPIKRRAARAGELKALQLHARLSEAAHDPDLALDLRRALDDVTDDARALAASLLHEGVADDVAIARRLGWSKTQLAAAWRALHDLIAP
ncbi:MAG: hypothetical protein INH41_22180 [Myxococcaceae bacterium]|jgi:hypothetical protein|nr:hypothetical protein [Myxococcaceae bacterium]MCA3015104.1 hypothetical protein [Myxococcaceae bacterium]